MDTFETSATVEERGQVRVAGVPFAPGTEVEVTITPKAPPATGLRQTAGASTPDSEDIFAEMQPYEAQGSTPVDDSREAIYTRLDGE